MLTDLNWLDGDEEVGKHVHGGYGLSPPFRAPREAQAGDGRRGVRAGGRGGCGGWICKQGCPGGNGELSDNKRALCIPRCGSLYILVLSHSLSRPLPSLPCAAPLR